MRFKSTRYGMALVGAAMAFLSGCALTTKSDSVIFRYFTPEHADLRATIPAADRAKNAQLALKVGRINSASYLKDRIAFQGADYEIGYYDDLVWTEKPESYLRRAIVKSMFEDQGVRQIVSGLGPTLEIELTAFEEMRAPRHVALVRMTWLVRDDQFVQAQDTVTVERPIAGPKESEPSAIASAMSESLNEAVKQVSARVVETIAKNP